MFQCPKCETTTESLRGWKRHMTRYHEGYTDGDLQTAAGQVEGAEAAQVSGFDTLQEAAAQAPEKETGPAPAETVPGKVRTAKKRLSKEEQITLAVQESLTEEMMRSLASDPWNVLALVLGEPEMKLNPDEEAKLTTAYFECAKRLGILFENRLWFLWIVGRLNFQIIQSRLPILSRHFPSLFVLLEKPKPDEA